MYLDSKGVAGVPSGATGLNMSFGGIVDFLNMTSQGQAFTDSCGDADMTWNPSLTGVYALQVRLPASLNLTVATNTDQTMVNGSMNIINYYYVVKRSIDYTVDSQSDFHTAVFETCADTYALVNSSATHGSESTVLMGKWGSNEYRSFVCFNISSIPQNAYILSARLNLYECLTVGENSTANFEVHRVTSNWYESTLNGNFMPTYESNASWTFTDSNSSACLGWLFLNVTQDVRFWINGTANYGFALLSSSDGLKRKVTFLSREYNDFDWHPSLEVSYLTPTPKFVADAFDSALQAPVCNMPIQVNANGTPVASGSTNQSGIFDFSSWNPTFTSRYNMTVGSAENGTYAMTNSSGSIFDYRWPTAVASKDGNLTDTTNGASLVLNFTLASSDLFALRDMLMKLHINGTFTNGTSYSYGGSNVTTRDGAAGLSWTVPALGTYSVRGFFEGNTSYLASEAYMSVTVNTQPLSFLFNVSPTAFKPGDLVTLNATIMDPFSNSRYTNPVEVQFLNFSSSGANGVSGASNSTGGVALLNVTYPTNGTAYAFRANITKLLNQPGKVVQTLMSSPVQLTVGKPTVMSLSVQNASDLGPSKYRVWGALTSNGNAVQNVTVHLKINSTSSVFIEDSLVTIQGGLFGDVYDFQPRVNSSQGSPCGNVDFTVEATYQGGTAANVSAIMKTLNDQTYASCTTVQYSEYVPCSNSTVVMVDPHAIAAAAAKRTPEQMQEEAEQTGSLRVWHEFSWFFPWYRMHSVCVYAGVDQFDQGTSPIPLVGETLACAEPFLNMLRELWWRVIWPIAGAVAGAEFTALIASNLGPIGFGAALMISIGTKGLSLIANWNSVNGLVSALIGNIFSTVIGMLKWTWGFVAGFFRLLSGGLDLAEFGFGNLYRIFSFPVNVAFGGTILTRLSELGAVA